MKMRELEERTGVGREAIRVYLRYGIVPEPLSQNGTDADYGEGHVRAVLAVRNLQQDSRLTLGQIADVVSGRSTEERIEPVAFRHLEELVATGVGLDDRLVAISSLTDKNPNALEDARIFHSIGAAVVIDDGGEPKLSLTDAQLVTIWGEMRRAGFAESVDFKPELLLFYVQAAAGLADNEATKFLERTQGRISEEEAAAMLHVGLPRMLDFFGLLRLKFFLQNIRHMNMLPGRAPHPGPRRRSRRRSGATAIRNGRGAR
ncbi:MAG: merR regulatory family protein [Alphaproteobacteria bacterium]|nr:merR regulatory family protein [Alphaproteobacteria bacterium]